MQVFLGASISVLIFFSLALHFLLFCFSVNFYIHCYQFLIGFASEKDQVDQQVDNISSYQRNLGWNTELCQIYLAVGKTANVLE
jgi:hypothetical protein